MLLEREQGTAASTTKGKHEANFPAVWGRPNRQIHFASSNPTVQSNVSTLRWAWAAVTHQERGHGGTSKVLRDDGGTSHLGFLPFCSFPCSLSDVCLAPCSQGEPVRSLNRNGRVETDSIKMLSIPPAACGTILPQMREEMPPNGLCALSPPPVETEAQLPLCRVSFWLETGLPQPSCPLDKNYFLGWLDDWFQTSLPFVPERLYICFPRL
ncbi:uncharacterized protein LOC125104699 [Lutra lutra]|uniref:uncharacterized protein LOC125104699 n=1 Tax=Lutra lutra TaxID=9657 RepID=UPI001FD0DB37|nr:uncharacterized protein LOC125104699 [Lutra lutra]